MILTMTEQDLSDAVERIVKDPQTHALAQELSELLTARHATIGRTARALYYLLAENTAQYVRTSSKTRRTDAAMRRRIQQIAHDGASVLAVVALVILAAPDTPSRVDA